MGKGTKRVAALESQNAELLHAQEQLVSGYTMLQRQLEDLQYIDLTGGGLSPGEGEVLSEDKRKATLQRIRRLRHENPIAKQAIKLTKRFVFGKGISYQVEDDDIREIVDAMWNDPENQTVLTSHSAMLRRFDETLTDGEIFLALFTATEAPWVRYGTIRVEEIRETLYDPDNDQIAVWYKRVFRERKYDAEANGGQGGWEPIVEQQVRYYRDWRITDERLADIESRGLSVPRSKQALDDEDRPVYVYHRMVNEIRTAAGWRGVSELYASREWLRVFKEFMEDRGAINAAANAFAYRRKIKGGPAKVQGLTGSIGGRAMPDSESITSPLDVLRHGRQPAGSFYDSNQGVDLEPIRADTGATNAIQDARMFLSSAGAGVATPVNYLGDANTSLAGAQAIELPMVKGYEDWQTFVRVEFQELATFTISIAQEKPMEDIDASEREMAWLFTPIMSGEVNKRVTANAQLTQQVAPQNREVKKIAIEGALQALDVPNAALKMDAILAEEDRIFEEKEEQRKLQMERFAQPPLPGGLPGGASSADGNGRNGNGHKPEGQSVGGVTIPATSPDAMRLIAGRPPSEPSTGPRTRRQ